jgi:hypothetical protein
MYAIFTRAFVICALNFKVSQFKVKFWCAKYSTSPKNMQVLIWRKIPHACGRKKGVPLYDTICNLSSSSTHSRRMVHHQELDLFHDTLVVCGYSKYKCLKVNPWHSTLSHYINYQLFQSLWSNTSHCGQGSNRWYRKDE